MVSCRTFATLACLPGLALASASAKDSGNPDGGFQQYMQTYAGQYMGGGGGKGSSGTPQKFMDQYLGGGKKGSNLGDFKQQAQHYLKMYAGNFSDNSQGGFQSYIDQYVGGQGGGSAGYEKYVQGFQKYMQGMDGGNGGYDKYMQGFQKYMHGFKSHMEQYANASNMQLQKYAEGLEQNPSECTTAECLCTWHKNRVGVLKATVPVEESSFGLDAAEKEYKGMLAKFAQNHSTTVAKLGLSKACQPKAAPSAAALASETLGAFAGLSVPALAGFLGAASALLLLRPRMSNREEEDTERAYLALA